MSGIASEALADTVYERNSVNVPIKYVEETATKNNSEFDQVFGIGTVSEIGLALSTTTKNPINPIICEGSFR